MHKESEIQMLWIGDALSPLILLDETREVQSF